MNALDDEIIASQMGGGDPNSHFAQTGSTVDVSVAEVIEEPPKKQFNKKALVTAVLLLFGVGMGGATIYKEYQNQSAPQQEAFPFAAAGGQPGQENHRLPPQQAQTAPSAELPPGIKVVQDIEQDKPQPAAATVATPAPPGNPIASSDAHQGTAQTQAAAVAKVAEQPVANSPTTNATTNVTAAVKAEKPQVTAPVQVAQQQGAVPKQEVKQETVAPATKPVKPEVKQLVKQEPKPATKPAPPKTNTKDTPASASASANGDGEGGDVKPLVSMSAAQIGLRYFTADAISVSTKGATPVAYRVGDALPSGEKIKHLDPSSQTLVTDRRVIRIN